MRELDNKEKALVALASAMAAGCTRCAENLHPMGRAAGASEEEIEWALCEGLRARESATVIMRRKAEALMDRPLKLVDLIGVTPPGSIAEIVRIAAAAAGNSAAEATRHIGVARFSGVGDPGIATALAVARKVRSMASAYADEAIDIAGKEASSGPEGTGEADAPHGDVAQGPSVCCPSSSEKG